MARVTQERIQSFAFIISIMMCAALAGGFLLPSFVICGQPQQIQLEDRINPNNAPAASLLRLPDIGLARALAVVAYRENFGERKGDGPAFRDVTDLQRVRGIGPRTAQNMSQWLKFE